MNIKFILIGLLLLLSSAYANVSFSEEQQVAIKTIVKNYLLESPEILLEASVALQDKQQQQLLERAKAAIPKNKTQLFANNSSPILGNKQGTIYLVEFIDYACGHCRRMADVVDQVISENTDLKVVIKHFPVLGSESDYAAKMALAANHFGKYQDYHQQALELDTPFTKVALDKLAKKVGIDLNKAQKYLESSKVEQDLLDVVELAQIMGVLGTPAFVLASKIDSEDFKYFYLPGSVSLEQLNQLIVRLRA